MILRHNLNIKVTQIEKLIYTEFLGSNIALPPLKFRWRENAWLRYSLKFYAVSVATAFASLVITNFLITGAVSDIHGDAGIMA